MFHCVIQTCHHPSRVLTYLRWEDPRRAMDVEVLDSRVVCKSHTSSLKLVQAGLSDLCSILSRSCRRFIFYRGFSYIAWAPSLRRKSFPNLLSFWKRNKLHHLKIFPVAILVRGTLIPLSTLSICFLSLITFQVSHLSTPGLWISYCRQSWQTFNHLPQHTKQTRRTPQEPRSIIGRLQTLHHYNSSFLSAATNTDHGLQNDPTVSTTPIHLPIHLQTPLQRHE